MILVFCVTNDLTTDQRMHKICNTLASVGHEVTLIGRLLPKSRILPERSFRQVRIPCKYTHGPLFYAEYNFKLWRYLKKSNADIYIANDLDTLTACFLRVWLTSCKLYFDSHEYFTEVPELKERKLVRAVWKGIAKGMLWRTQKRYTVSLTLSKELEKVYKMPFEVVVNSPMLISNLEFKKRQDTQRIILYQGALNKGRGLFLLLTAVLNTDWQCWLAGTGDEENVLREWVNAHDTKRQIHFLGVLSPEELVAITPNAALGYNILENEMGMSYYYSLSNKFFDYAMAGIPSLSSPWPEYIYWIEKYQSGWTLFPESDALASFLNSLDLNGEEYGQKKEGAIKMALEQNWAREELTLLKIYQDV